MNPDSWHVIPEGAISIDFSGCKFSDDIQEKLKESFGFPDYYGKNWSAFWDCLSDFAMSEEDKREIIVSGLDKLPAELKEYTRKMREIMLRAETLFPHIDFAFMSN
jgi:RNAse (barnase) inhibitor barstar